MNRYESNVISPVLPDTWAGCVDLPYRGHKALIHEPLLHAREDRGETALLLRHLAAARALQTSLLQQAHHGGKPRVVHDIGKAAFVGGYAHAHGLEEDVFRKLDDARQQCTAAG